MEFYLNKCTNGKTRMLTYGYEDRGYAAPVFSPDPTAEQILEACNRLIEYSLKTPMLPKNPKGGVRVYVKDHVCRLPNCVNPAHSAKDLK